MLIYGEVPIYLSDCARLHAHTDWRPARSGERTLADVDEWASAHSDPLARTLGLARDA